MTGATAEAALKKESRVWLRSIGAYIYSPTPVGYGAPTLDDLCCIKGKFVAIEYKAPGKLPTPRQAQTITDVCKAGGIAFATDSIERTKKYIEDHVLGAYHSAD